MMDEVADWLLEMAVLVKHKKVVGVCLIGIPIAFIFGLEVMEYGFVEAVVAALGGMFIVAMIVGGFVLFFVPDDPPSRVS